jgi:hypothetical protein
MRVIKNQTISKSFVLVEVIFSVVLFSIIMFYTLNSTLTLQIENKKSYERLTNIILLESTKIFLEKKNNFSPIKFEDDKLYYDNNLLLSGIKSYSLSNDAKFKVIDICLLESQVNDYHFLKTRNAGDNNFLDIHLVFNCLITLMDAHKVVNKIEEEIRNIDKSKNWIINIHMDPYDDSEFNNINKRIN